MYLTYLKGLVTDALRQVFDSTFPTADFQGVHVSIDYPMERQHYPGVWVNYEDQDSLTIAGIDHREIVYDDPDDTSSPQHAVTRWLFTGEITLTFVALSSRERDDLYDEFVRIFAFSRLEEAQTDFRTLIEDNDFIAAQINWDELRPHGDGSAPGTPWGTENEVIYEKSVGFDIIGEFVSDPAKNTMALLSQVIVIGTNADDEDNPFTLGVPRID